MELEGSLPHSQVPATFIDPKPAQSSPYPHILLNIILPSTPGSLNWFISLRFPPPEPCKRLSPTPSELRAPPIS
jgi:hypothetical protein